MNSKLESREGFGGVLNDLNLNQYGVELGVAEGYFSESLLKNSNLKILFSIDFLVFRMVLLGPTPYQKAVGSRVISFICGYSLQTSLRLFQSG